MAASCGADILDGRSEAEEAALVDSGEEPEPGEEETEREGYFKE